MGTEAQREHRRNYADKVQSLIDAVIRGDWSDDESLKGYLRSIGEAPDKALFNQFGSQGGYATYGPSWDPVWKNDFVTGEQIPFQGEGETWYDPSVASNWQKTPQLKSDRMRGFFNWRDKNMDSIDRNFGGNALAAWYRGRAQSNRPNSPDMSWYNEGNKGLPTTPVGPPVAPPVSPTSWTASSESRGRLPTKPQPPIQVDPALTGSTTRRPITRKPARPAWYSTWKY